MALSASTALLVAIIALALAVVGIGSPAAPKSLGQSGTVTITISTGTSTGTGSVTFSPAFASTPKTRSVSFNTVPNSQDLPSTALDFQAQTTLFSLVVPNSEGEYNAQILRVYLSFLGLNKCSFQVTIGTGDGISGSKMGLQSSPDQSTWTDVGNSFVNIDTAGLHDSITENGGNVNLQNISSGKNYLRPVSQGGNGIAISTIGAVRLLCVTAITAYSVGIITISATSMIVGVVAALNVVSNTNIPVNWLVSP